MDIKDSTSISPTAHYTAYVWYRNGMSHKALATSRGRVFYRAMEPLNRLSAAFNGGLTLERFLLQRHNIIDSRLGQAIERGKVGQILEIACGLSPRGFKFAERYKEKGLKVIEADLPDMAALKKQLLENASLSSPDHQVISIDALADSGPDSISAIAEKWLDPDLGTAIITEGLVDYFDKSVTIDMWRRFGKVLQSMSGGVYFSDLYVEDELPDSTAPRVFRRLLEMTTRGTKLEHFQNADDAKASLEDAQFDQIDLHRPVAFSETLDIPQLRRDDIVRIVEAWVNKDQN